MTVEVISVIVTIYLFNPTEKLQNSPSGNYIGCKWWHTESRWATNSCSSNKSVSTSRELLPSLVFTHSCTKRPRDKEQQCSGEKEKSCLWNNEQNVWGPFYWQLTPTIVIQAGAILPDNSRGQCCRSRWPLGRLSPTDWTRAVCISFRTLQEICHEIVWDWTSLYFNCHHLESQPCRAAIAHTVGWVVCTCVEMTGLYGVFNPL